ncbi:hypothetical protein AB2B41_07790 [Marimonas sp. MJW-29]|uniref:SH3 domain-containing protein n=1 Tax=Sulfitobacter sediminis TaxID=3234186 RepID=A0ABV3RKS6_9RHOB
MLDIFFAMLAAGMNGAPAPSGDTQELALAQPPAVVAPAQEGTATAGSATVQIAPDNVTVGQGVVIGGNATGAGAQDNGFNMSVVPAGLVAEPQTPSGKFTTAAEVKPILSATKGNWVAVREYDGKDWLYVTHVWSWRCGLKAMAISVNDEAMQNWPLPPCHEQFTTPNAVLEDDGLPVLTFQPGSVETITIQIVYDDLSMDVGRFERGNVLIP